MAGPALGVCHASRPAQRIDHGAERELFVVLPPPNLSRSIGQLDQAVFAVIGQSGLVAHGIDDRGQVAAGIIAIARAATVWVGFRQQLAVVVKALTALPAFAAGLVDNDARLVVLVHFHSASAVGDGGNLVLVVIGKLGSVDSRCREARKLRPTRRFDTSLPCSTVGRARVREAEKPCRAG